MFKGLKSNTAVVQPVIPDDITDLALEHALCDTSDLHEIDQLVATIDNLVALRASIETYGLSKQLLAFADHNKMLSTYVANIPSVEAFTSNPGKYTKEAAMESIGLKIQETLERMAHAIHMHLSKFKTFYTVVGVLTIWPAAVAFAILLKKVKGGKLTHDEYAEAKKHVDEMTNKLHEDMEKLKEMKHVGFKSFPKFTEENGHTIMELCISNTYVCKNIIEHLEHEHFDEHPKDPEKAREVSKEVSEAMTSLHALKKLVLDCRTLANHIGHLPYH